MYKEQTAPVLKSLFGRNMKLSFTSKVAIGQKILTTLVLKKKIPLTVGWAITKRCNARCTYCGKWKDDHDDTLHEEAVSLCNQFIEAGTRIISLTGGEPLIRDDLGELVDRLKSRDIRIILATNGILVPKSMDVIRRIDRLNISIDGPKDVHERYRGQGSFNQAMEAIKAAKSIGVSVLLQAVIHGANVHRVPELLSLAESQSCKINLQPIGQTLVEHAMEEGSFPEPEDMRRAFAQIIKEKKKSGGRLIENSLPALRHILRWPKGEALVCRSRVISCRVEPDGHVHNCGRKRNNLEETDYREHGFLQAFRSLPVMTCTDCWCSSRFELNMLATMNPLFMAGMLKRF